MEQATEHENKTNAAGPQGGELAALKERQAAARARKRAAEERREAMRSARELPAEVEADEIEARDEEAIADAEEKHGSIGKKIRVIRTELGCVILKRPHPASYKKFRDKAETDTVAFEKLVRPCVVYPDAVALDLILDELAGVLDRCANAVVELAGFRQKEAGPK